MTGDHFMEYRMSRRSRIVLTLLILLTGFQSLAAYAYAPAPTSKQIKRWSDPSTWDGKVPAAGDDVLIPDGQTILLDVSPPQLGGLTIRGSLVFDRKDLVLSIEWMLITGLLEIGTADSPFLQNASIILTDLRPDDVGGMGDRVIAQMGGSIDIHGAPRVANWVRLAETIEIGDGRMWLDRQVDWGPGDKIVIASTDFDQEQAEFVTITAVTGQLVEFDRPARFMHWGIPQVYGEFIVDERAEVGLLSHNISISADESSYDTMLGGHIMSMAGTLSMSNVSLARMGQGGKLARYPIHFHMKGDQAAADLVRNVSLVDSFNRCITIHGSHGVRLEGNVAAGTFGHCFFLEDGIETENELVDNLGLLTRAPDENHQLLPSDELPATYWITNPDNDLIGNVAAGSEAFGFWYAFPEHPTGLSASAETDESIWPRRTPLGAFRNNVAHSNGFRGLNVDDGPDAEGFTSSTVYEPRQEPNPYVDAESPSVTAVFKSFSGYKNRERAIWLRGTDHVVRDSVLADNGIGATFASYDSYLDASLVVGETANIGTVTGPEEPVGSGGRALPMPWDPSFRISGFEFYDGIVGVRDTTFAGFIGTPLRKAHAIGFLRNNAFYLDPASYATGIRFLDGSIRVYTQPAAIEFDGDKMRVFRDLDGSVTGRAGSWVAANQPLLGDSSCLGRPEWNAFVCEDGFRSVILSNVSYGPSSLGPVMIRNNQGDLVELRGIGGDFEYQPTEFAINLRANAPYDVTSMGNAGHLRLTLARAQPGEWILVSLQWNAPTVFVFDGYDVSILGLLPRVTSRAALEASTGESWYRDSSTGAVVLKLYVHEGDTDTTREICSTWLCIQTDTTLAPRLPGGSNRT
jgi:hypothetical protein